MVQGTASSVGKSLMAAALCRIFARTGLSVAPFKSQNMSNNAAALPDGSEIGRAQWLQALAARAEPRVEMNPILLKPEGDSISQVILMGRPFGTLSAAAYYAEKPRLWEAVVEATELLRSSADLVVIEGAGSPAEINLADLDIVNMAVARQFGAPVILVADIDPGGVFAQVVGTLSLLDEEDRARVKGVVINKFRGDPSLFASGIAMLEDLTGIPVLGVVPMLKGLSLPDEDGATIRCGSAVPARPAVPGGTGGPGRGGRRLDIAVIRLPHIANFDDFDALAREESVELRFVDRPEDLGRPDALILPGTKATMADLSWIKAEGFGDGIRWLSRTGVPVVGICGGYQMLGTMIDDPDGVEGGEGNMEGLGLLSVRTFFAAGKKVAPRRGFTSPLLGGRLSLTAGLPIEGYEIHCGETIADEGLAFSSLGPLGDEGREAVPVPDGSWSPKGIWGSYLHGIFDSDEFRKAWLASLGAEAVEGRRRAGLEESLDALADAVETALDMDRLRAIIGMDGPAPEALPERARS